ncbi:conjugal transfer protein TraA [Vibrio parahaemolyticus]|uniref:conjugal transfer protein TraA n=1 Tax=Vibrio parahaemolyticus TaxID=670 RepID=UPI0003FF03F6|nr:conjugal transfer protein TraA [Vibrio parahaemolyticus]HCH6235692.1 conjugal transfer protein TraA [Vibrio parahaemolyticus]HCM1465276.1 conjugal transfer protein TraA [Vibrio parahaemolyticus]
MPINRLQSFCAPSMKRTSSTVKENSLLVNKVSHKAIDEAIFKTMKIAKNSPSSERKEKYGILKNHVSFVCNLEINRKLTENAASISNGKLLNLKRDIINAQVLSGFKMDYLMCSAPLQNYLASQLDKNQEIKALSKTDREKVLQIAYELLDNKIDEKIIEKNLKTPTIAAAKELIEIVCKEQLSSIEKDKDLRKRVSTLVSNELKFDFSLDKFAETTLVELDDVFHKYQ